MVFCLHGGMVDPKELLVKVRELAEELNACLDTAAELNMRLDVKAKSTPCVEFNYNKVIITHNVRVAGS
jgi:hypothetical protein